MLPVSSLVASGQGRYDAALYLSKSRWGSPTDSSNRHESVGVPHSCHKGAVDLFPWQKRRDPDEGSVSTPVIVIAVAGAVGAVIAYWLITYEGDLVIMTIADL
jgi:hypothetical protein